MSELPEWLDDLYTLVSNCIEPHSPTGPLGVRYYEQEDLEELLFYPSPIELVGGEQDGAVVSAGFSLDLRELMLAFERVDEVHWCARSYGPFDPEGPNVSIGGIFQRHLVFVRILAFPPDDEQPETKLDAC